MPLNKYHQVSEKYVVNGHNVDAALGPKSGRWRFLDAWAFFSESELLRLRMLCSDAGSLPWEVVGAPHFWLALFQFDDDSFESP